MLFLLLIKSCNSTTYGIHHLLWIYNLQIAFRSHLAKLAVHHHRSFLSGKYTNYVACNLCLSTTEGYGVVFVRWILNR